ncbi:riboflavin synthase [Meiothermus sp. QL-1]|uniref:riboflavin synthase n=1 Tax=Meiothermus sp. QL-1 TaxID=2058095 RepID=UPI000E0C4194|nr:riboflavin synthase [Meiothermus sp. QL-1]RDI96375.1 riboflavin synthase [Meiothermus sp. QL-1]
MFTGIVEQTGQIRQARTQSGNRELYIAPQQMWDDLGVGESIAVSGVCLTVVAFDRVGFTVQLSQETLAKTAPYWQEGAWVNLERALAANGRLGGHLVTGHVDGVGRVLRVEPEDGRYVVWLEAPPHLARYLVPKGSVAVDGVSLTVVDVGGPAGSRPELPSTHFSLWLIPHTLAVTTLGNWQPGRLVNLEADILAKYLERLVRLEPVEQKAGPTL